MTNLLTEIKTLVVKAWDEFQSGLKWFNTEAQVIGQWLAKAEPAAAAAAQKAIAAAETGAEFLIQYSDDALAEAVKIGVPVAEEALESHMSTWMGGGMAAQLVTSAGQSLFADGVTAFKAMVDGAAVKLQHAAANEASKLEGDLAPPPGG